MRDDDCSIEVADQRLGDETALKLSCDVTVKLDLRPEEGIAYQVAMLSPIPLHSHNHHYVTARKLLNEIPKKNSD
ncbi:unnamed protein product [Anisakis simplex]|uniref:DNA-directed RNA polymerase n=1 Tax=Anisakis simplex TaxID=6269 RepID=A0A0M3JKT5_ANISI|nr:unnamed protein product [Anisakis simplex]